MEPEPSLSSNPLEDSTTVNFNPQLVQIKATSEDEVKRRIAAFMWNKRSEIDERNIREFICPLSSDVENSCARVDAVYVHREGSKSHINLKRVHNQCGPQTQVPADVASEEQPRLPLDLQRAEAVEERLANMEAHLNMDHDHGDIFSRIKALEKRISILEGLSLEYFSNGVPRDMQRGVLTESKQGKERDPIQKPPENLAFIDSRILLLKESLKQKTREIKRQCQN